MQLAKARSLEPATRASSPAWELHSSTHESLSNRESFQQVVERALDCTGATGAALAMLQDHDMVCVATTGSLAPPLGARMQTQSGFSGRCVRLRRVLRCDDAESDSRIDRERCRALGIRSMVAVPIEENGVVVGLLEVFSRNACAFSEISDIDLEFLARNALALGRGPQAVEDKNNGPENQQENSQTPLPVESDRRAWLRSMYGYSKLSLGLTCLGIAVGGWLMGRRVVHPPTHADVQTDTLSTSQSDPVNADTNDRPEIRKLAEQGDSEAQFALGAQYATGEAVQQDYSEAARWFAKAAEQGHVLAQATLGAYYLAGRGVPMDMTKAYFWSILAQAGGDQASEYRINILKSRLSTSEIVEIKQQARDWIKVHRPSVKELSIP
jgi:hypothetical protein